MTCDSYELKINAWIDGELPFEEQRELQVHLANCAQCKQLEQDLRSVHSQLQTHLEPMQQQVANLAASTICMNCRSNPSSSLDLRYFGQAGWQSVLLQRGSC
jgi:anti-sigma factor RsiW